MVKLISLSLWAVFLLTAAPATKACFSSTITESLGTDALSQQLCRVLTVDSVAVNDIVTCSTSCTSAATTVLEGSIDGDSFTCTRRLNEVFPDRALQVPEAITTDSDSSGCSTQIKLTPAAASTSLNVKITASNYVDLVLTCSCETLSTPSPTPLPTTAGPTVAGSPTTPSPTPSPSPTVNVCFSGSTVVQVQNKGDVLMKDLELGDKVLTGPQKYESVYAFGHRHEDLEATFLQIHVEGADAPLEMTEKHLAFDASTGHAVPAGELKVGDRLLRDSQPVEITKISVVYKKGLYMPLTPSGTIVVDGLLASAYVSITEDAPRAVGAIKQFPLMTDQNLLHWWMSPMRMLCMGVSSKFCSSDKAFNAETGILHWLTFGQDLAVFANARGVWFVGPGALLFVAFGLLNLIEYFLMGPSVVVVGTLLSAGLMYHKFQRNGASKEKTL